MFHSRRLSNTAHLQALFSH